MKRFLACFFCLSILTLTFIAFPLGPVASMQSKMFERADITPKKVEPRPASLTNDLFFSEYIEGSGNNKAIEIYNGTGAAVDLAAGNYVLQLYSNGSLTVSASGNLSGTIVDGDVFVFAHSSANAAILAQADDTAVTLIGFNGNDTLILRKGGAAGSIVDVIGQLGFAGTEWGTGDASTADNTIVRKSTICSGDVNETDLFDPAVEWDGFPQNTSANLGLHTAFCAPSAAPASLGGRVITSQGQGIRSVVVMVSGGALSGPRMMMTGTFGYFRFDDLRAGETYVVTVNAKRYAFAVPSQVVNLTDNVTDMNFVALQ